MIIAQITICCDHCHSEYDDADVAAYLVREKARADGWLVSLPGGRDVCSECRERGLR